MNILILRGEDMNVTIKDVAKEAGVSVATVSRVLNKTSNVTPDTIMLVKEAIEKLHYRPNFLGRNLRKCETNVILAILPGAEQTFYADILKGMQYKAADLGYDIIYSISSGHFENEKRQLNMLYNKTVDAAILFSSKMPTEEIKKINANYNIALVCEGIREAGVLTVSVNDEQAGFEAVKTLFNKGYNKIGLITSQFSVKSSFDRENGYKRAIAEFGAVYRSEYIFSQDYTFKSGQDAMDYFLNLPEPPEAVFAISDILAVGAINRATARGLNVGKDIAIMGFDNISLSEIYTPSVSTVTQPCFDMGSLAVERLIHNIGSENKDNRHYIMPHRVILRQSTGD